MEGLMGLVYLVIVVLMLVGGWKMFEKAGKPGWGILIPIYNTILMLEIAGRPLWWFILFFVPLVNVVVSVLVSVLVSIDVAKKFGKSEGFGIGLAFLGFIFIPILGFGDAVYEGA